jgi:excisionase family DNA binding protein
MTVRTGGPGGDRPAPLVVSVTEAAGMLGISRTLAYDLVNRRRLPSMRLAGQIRILRQDVERLVEGRAGGVSHDAALSEGDDEPDEPAPGPVSSGPHRRPDLAHPNPEVPIQLTLFETSSPRVPAIAANPPNPPRS